MKNIVTTLSIIVVTFLAISMSSCDKETTDPPTVNNSAYSLTIDGVTSTNVTGEITVCSDGYFTINGSAPDGGVLNVTISEIAVGETRAMCDQPNWNTCIEDGGISLTIAANQTIYSSVSGTATRTSESDITVSGSAVNINDAQDYAFTLTATAGLVYPFTCR